MIENLNIVGRSEYMRCNHCGSRRGGRFIYTRQFSSDPDFYELAQSCLSCGYIQFSAVFCFWFDDEDELIKPRILGLDYLKYIHPDVGKTDKVVVALNNLVLVFVFGMFVVLFLIIWILS